MKKSILLSLVLISLPIAAFAQLGVGGAAFFKSPVLIAQPIDSDNLAVNQFSFGGDVRFNMTPFQLEALVLYSAGEYNSLNAYLDAGIAIDIAVIRLSAGAGPTFTGNFGKSPATQVGLNAKIGADIMMGKVSAGLSYIMALNIDNGIDINTSSGLLGASVLFWL